MNGEEFTQAAREQVTAPIGRLLVNVTCSGANKFYHLQKW